MNNNVNKHKKPQPQYCEHNKHILTVRDNKYDGTYLISTLRSPDLERETLGQKGVDKNALIPVFSLYKVTAESNTGHNDKENSKKSFLKKLHTFHIDLTTLPMESDGGSICYRSNKKGLTVEVDDICTILEKCSIEEISNYLIKEGKNKKFPDITLRN